MKSSSRCPKCSGTELLHLTRVAERVGKKLPDAVQQSEAGTDATNMVYTWRVAVCDNKQGYSGHDYYLAGIVEAYVCKGCGFTEFYTKDPQSIQPGTHVVEIVAKASGPYR